MKKSLYIFLMLCASQVYGEAKKYVLTGGAGVGKTSIINYLKAELNQHVVRESATDLIALDLAQGIEKPYIQKGFNVRVVSLQKLRQERVNNVGEGLVFFDRSPVDVLVYETLSGSIADEVSQAAYEAKDYYEKTVFLIENLGSVLQSEIRAEGLDETLMLERMQEENYRKYGFRVIKIKPGSVKERAEQILNVIKKDSSGSK